MYMAINFFRRKIHKREDKVKGSTQQEYMLCIGKTCSGIHERQQLSSSGYPVLNKISFSMRYAAASSIFGIVPERRFFRASWISSAVSISYSWSSPLDDVSFSFCHWFRFVNFFLSVCHNKRPLMI